MIGAISVSEQNPIDLLELQKILKNERYEGRDFMPDVSTVKPEEYGQKEKECLVLIDTGTKYSIIRNMLRTGYRVVRLPYDASYEQIVAYNPKGVVISNGPGDPKICKRTIQTAARLIKTSMPTLGICLGNQILALAGGANTYKLKFGHRGQNKSCIDTNNGHVYVTSQNHGYGIDSDSLKKTGFKVWFSNADDGTVEGIQHSSKPIIAVQFHPEAAPGPYDCTFVFDRFSQIISNGITEESFDEKHRVEGVAFQELGKQLRKVPTTQPKIFSDKKHENRMVKNLNQKQRKGGRKTRQGMKR